MSAVLSVLTIGAAHAVLQPCPGQTVGDFADVQARIAANPFAVAPGDCVCDIASYFVEKGFYKLNATGVATRCVAGSYCPGNMTQPAYCCAGYVCDRNATQMELCPEGTFCPIQSVERIDCPALQKCAERTDEPENFGIALSVFFFLVLVLLGHWAFEFASARKENLYTVLIQQAHDEGDGPTTRRHGARPGSDVRLDDKNDGKLSPKSLGDTPATTTFDIDFEGLEYTLPDGVNIMRGVSGAFRHGRLCAVMGPSGAGKSTLFNLVTGKARRTAGIVRVNKEQMELSKYQKLIGFVPQEDVMIREDLTVLDILRFSAHRRLPRSLSRAEKDRVVARCVEILELSAVVNNVVGDARTRGISGGQRKRVNIGMELVADPSVLFLDEPTTGLDSTTSLSLCATLRRLCRRTGLTAAAIIHSPSRRTFAEFDDLCLLGKGGRLIFMGPVDRAMPYFQNTLGFRLPPRANPADFLLEVALGRHASEKMPKFRWPHLYGLWDAHIEACKRAREDGDEADQTKAYASFMSARVKAIGGSADSKSSGAPPILRRQNSLLGDDDVDNCHKCCEALRETVRRFWLTTLHDTWQYWFGPRGVCRESAAWLHAVTVGLFASDPVRDSPRFHVVFWLCLVRSFKQVYGNLHNFLLENVLHVGAGLFLAINAQDLRYQGRVEPEVCAVLSPAALMPTCTQPVRDGYADTARFLVFAVGFAGIAVGTKTLGAEQTVFHRHASTGLDTLPYFLAKIVNDVPRIALAGVLCALFMFVKFHTVGSSGRIVLICVFLYWTAFAQGYFISTIVNYRAAPLAGVVFTLFWVMVFSGVQIRLTQRSSMPSFVQFLFQLSPGRWAIEAFYVNEMSRYDGYLDISARMEYFQYDISNYWTAIGSLALIGLFWQGIALAMLKFTHRDKTQ